MSSTRAEVPLSVVIPVYNEEKSLPKLFERLYPVLDGLGVAYEVILVNDGSRDRSGALLAEQHAKRPKETRVFELNTNYGQHMAILAGFDKSRGDVVVTLDADLQNPPEEIPKLLAAIADGHDVVGGMRRERKDVMWRRSASRLVNIVRGRITSIEMTDQGCMLRAYTRPVVDAVVESGAVSTFIPALAYSLSSNPTEIEVAHEERAEGESAYSFYKLLRLNFDLVTGFSLAPLQLFTIFGLCVSFASLVLVIVLAARRIFIGPEEGGLFTLFGILFFLVSVAITGIGLIGEYVGRTYQAVRTRTRYHIARELDVHR